MNYLCLFYYVGNIVNDIDGIQKNSTNKNVKNY